MRWMILCAAAIVSASSAHAQVTRCGQEFGKWVCRTQPSQPQARQMPNVMDSMAQGYALGAAIRRDAEARRAAQPAPAPPLVERSPLDQERERLEAVDIVKGYIRAGMCEDARRVALQYFGQKGEDDARELCPN